MKNLFYFSELIEKKTEQIIGGKADKLDLKGVAELHGIPLSQKLNLEFRVGKEVEKEHTNSLQQASEIALDHLSEDPEYYTKLIKSGVVDEPKALALIKSGKTN